MRLNKLLSIAYYIGMGLVFIGVLMGVSDLAAAPWVLLGGTIPIVGVRLYNRLIGRPENQRIFSILLYSSLSLFGAFWGLFTNRSYWILFILIMAVIDAYASYRRIKK